MSNSDSPSSGCDPRSLLERPELAAKLSSGTKRRLLAPAPEGFADPGAPVRVLLRTAEPLGDPERSTLEAAGATVRTVAGDVVTAQMPLDRLGAVAALPFVRYLDLARPLHLEDKS